MKIAKIYSLKEIQEMHKEYLEKWISNHFVRIEKDKYIAYGRNHLSGEMELEILDVEVPF